MTEGQSPRMRFLALGDSYTIGESVSPSERWPVQMASMLREEGVEMDDPWIIARTGWTTHELSEAIDRENPEGPFDLVTLLVGVNNQYRGLDKGEYGGEFEALLVRAIGFAAGHPDRVIVLSIPDWGVTPFAEGRDRNAIAREIDEFNRINRELTIRFGAHYVDVTPVSRRAAVETSLVANDGLHPSGAMYRDWARMVFPVARRRMTKRRGG